MQAYFNLLRCNLRHMREYEREVAESLRLRVATEADRLTPHAKPLMDEWRAAESREQRADLRLQALRELYARVADQYVQLGLATGNQELVETPIQYGRVLAQCPCSVSDLCEKLATLDVELAGRPNPEQAEFARVQHGLLSAALLRAIDPSPELSGLRAELGTAVATAQRARERLRNSEHAANFGAEFVDAARSLHGAAERIDAVKARILDLFRVAVSA
jgi:hypothetical protein